MPSGPLSRFEVTEITITFIARTTPAGRPKIPTCFHRTVGATGIGWCRGATERTLIVSKASPQNGINPKVAPSGTGCVECMRTGQWWLHLRRCAECGHIGCCDDSPNQHATKHFHSTRHPVIASFEPGEEWFYDYTQDSTVKGLALAPPRWHPEDQPVPGPEGRVPPNWQSLLRSS